MSDNNSAIQEAFANADDERLLALLDAVRVGISSQAQQTFVGVQPETLFTCLGSRNERVIETTASLLDRFLGRLTPEAILADHQAQLIQGLHHPSPIVQRLALKHIDPRNEAQPEFVNLLASSGLLHEIILLLAHEDVSVTTTVSDILVKLALSGSGADLLFAPGTLADLGQVAAQSSVVAVRVDEVFVRVARHSPHLLQRCLDNGTLNWIPQTFASTDILLKLNTFELVSRLGEAPHGLLFLVSSGVFQAVLTDLRHAETFDLIKVACCKFLGSVLANEATPFSALESQFHFFSVPIALVSSSDAALKRAAFVAIASVMTSIPGLHFAITHEQSAAVARIFADFLMSVDTTEQEVGFDSLAAILDSVKNGKIDTSAVQEREAFYNLINDNRGRNATVVSQAVSLVTRPIPEPRNAAYHFLQSLVSQTWGRRMLVSFPGFIELMLDRRHVALDHNAYQWKYAIIQGMVHSDSGLTTEQMLLLRNYVREGVYYKEAGATVAVAEEAA